MTQVLLLKGADKLARNKKGRVPGDLFCPQVEEENKERIKRMLDMGVPHANKDPEPRDERVGPEPRGPAAEPPPLQGREELHSVYRRWREDPFYLLDALSALTERGPVCVTCLLPCSGREGAKSTFASSDRPRAPKQYELAS